MVNVRETAMKVIYDVEFNGAYSNMALKKALNTAELENHDKTFMTALVYGVIDKKITLDYVISRYSKLKLKKISKYILVILRMGIYQIMFMDKIPSSAAVNESVKLAKKYGHGASAGFVNGVLRNVSKGQIEYPEDRNEYLSVKYSFPMWICEKWIDDFGYDFTENLMSAFSEPSRLIIRPNILKISADKLCEELCRQNAEAFTEDGYIVCKGFDISNDSLYKNGYYTVQDAAAMQASKVLAPCEGDTVIDMCAAPGGKTTHMAELMSNKGRIYAFDVHEHKLNLINKNAKRLGVTIIKYCVTFHVRDWELYAVNPK